MNTLKEAVILRGDILSTSAIYSGINVNLLQNRNGLVNEPTEISLKIVLGLGPNKKWEVKRAEVLDDPSGNPVDIPCQAQTEDRSKIITSQRPKDPIQASPRAASAIRPKSTLPKITQPITAAPVVTKVWRPQVNTSKPLEVALGSTNPQQDLDKVSVNSYDFDSQGSNHSSLILTSSSGVDPLSRSCRGSTRSIEHGDRLVTGSSSLGTTKDFGFRWI